MWPRTAASHYDGFILSPISPSHVSIVCQIPTSIHFRDSCLDFSRFVSRDSTTVIRCSTIACPAFASCNSFHSSSLLTLALIGVVIISIRLSLSAGSSNRAESQNANVIKQTAGAHQVLIRLPTALDNNVSPLLFPFFSIAISSSSKVSRFRYNLRTDFRKLIDNFQFTSGLILSPNSFSHKSIVCLAGNPLGIFRHLSVGIIGFSGSGPTNTFRKSLCSLGVTSA